MNAQKQHRFNLRRAFLVYPIVLVSALFFAPLTLAQLPDILQPGNFPLDKFSKTPEKPNDDLFQGVNPELGTAPKITYARAADFVAPGGIWEIFLVLQDEEGDLKSVEWELHQFGPGGTSKGTLLLSLPRKKPKEGQEKFKRDAIENLSGYIELDTAGPDVLRHPGRFDGLQMRLIVVAVDRRGLQSKKRVFSLTFRLGAPRSARPVISGGKFSYRIGSIFAVFPDPIKEK